MKVRHVSEHNMRFSRKSLPSPCRSLRPAWSAHSVAWKGAEEAGCCSLVRASSKPAVANRKWKPRLGVHLPQVPYAFDFFFHRHLRSCWIYARSAAVDPCLHTCSHVWKDEQKNHMWLFQGRSCSHQGYRSLSKVFKRTLPNRRLRKACNWSGDVVLVPWEGSSKACWIKQGTKGNRDKIC